MTTPEAQTMEEDKDGLNGAKNGDKTVTIFGVGSLMDVQSTHNTMPSASNFRKGILPHHRRVYSLVSIGGIKSGRAILETNEAAALSARPVHNSFIKGIVFDIPEGEFPAYLEREHRYRIESIPVLEIPLLQKEHCGESIETILKQDFKPVNAFVCLEQTDEEYISSLPGGQEEWNDRVRSHYPDGRLWGRADILPMPRYMTAVMVAASTLGEEWLKDAVDNTYLVDGITSLRKYVQDRFHSCDTCGIGGFKDAFDGKVVLNQPLLHHLGVTQADENN